MTGSKSAESAVAQTPSSMSFIAFLETRLRQSPPAQKGARTRERLKIATASVLESNGYHAMRVTDITGAARLAEGSFYIYFKDKKEASLEVLSEFLQKFVDLFAPLEAVGTQFESIRHANLRWFAICRANAGLMRCLFQLGDQEDELAQLVHQSTRKWYQRIAHHVQLEREYTNSDTLLFAIYLMGSMMDELVRKMIVFPDQEFLDLLKSWGADDRAVAEATSMIWIRTFDSNAEPPADLAPVAEGLARLMWPRPAKPKSVT